MGGTIFSRLRLGANRLQRDQRGNALILTAAALIPIMGIVGSGVDIGRAYMTQLRLQQACDAGVLAGRRAMAAGTYSTAAQGEANKMFNFNMPTGIYGSEDIAFASQAQGTADVTGTATAKLPTALMYIFGTDEFNLSVACTAKLEISNVDVMMVLDVTGSMSQTNSGDSVNRITALKTATMDFFDTLTNADVGDGRLRFGVVPYSSAANVGKILYDRNPAWLSNSTTLPSREAQPASWINPETENNGSAFNNSAYVVNDWANNGTTITKVGNKTATSGNCSNATKSSSSATKYGSTSTAQTGQTEGYDERVTTQNLNQPYRYNEYRYVWSSNKCNEQQRTMEYLRTQKQTVTEDRRQSYIYKDSIFDVTSAKAGNAITTLTGDLGAAYSATWGGCLIERGNPAPFASNATAPSNALDMDIDAIPTNDPATQWKLMIPEISFPRARSVTTTNTTAWPDTLTISYSSASKDSGSGTDYQRYSKNWGNGWGVCPAAAMKLTKMTKTDRSSFNTYVNSLQPVGGTYHDAGMVWGVRLISPTGLFADENATAPNDRPISRHIVFMTDGEMAPNLDNLSFQGNEWTMHRIGATTGTELTNRHNNRFVQLCAAARDRGITVWVVSFGVGSNAQLNSCATSGEAYESANSTQLNANFQSIARQISKLRLSQ